MISGETEPSMDGRADGERQRGDLGKRKRTRRSGQGCRAKIIIEIRRRVEVFGLCKAERFSARRSSLCYRLGRVLLRPSLRCWVVAMLRASWGACRISLSTSAATPP